MALRMVRNSRNYRVLKLVHPGGFVEIHQKPITADEVMKKNPRHCVARPDVFRYPWVVVRPESVLKPGSVFYIVPFHTIHCLIQRNKGPNQNYSLQQRDLIDTSVEITYFHQFLTEETPDVSQTRSKIDYKIDNWPDDALFPKCLIRNTRSPEPDHCQGSLIKSGFELEHANYYCSTIQYLLDHFHTACDYENRKEFDQQANSFVKPSPSSLSDTSTIFPKVGSGLESESSKSLKSCLKKDSQGRSHGFRVRFDLPD